MLTFRLEVGFDCDSRIYNPDCHITAIFDQADAKTKKGMLGKAAKMGWVWNKAGKCFCPSCSKKHGISFDEKIT